MFCTSFTNPNSGTTCLIPSWEMYSARERMYSRCRCAFAMPMIPYIQPTSPALPEWFHPFCEPGSA